MDKTTRYLLRGLAAASAAIILGSPADAGDGPPLPDPDLLRAERRLIDLMLEHERQRIRDRLAVDLAQALQGAASALDRSRDRRPIRLASTGRRPAAGVSAGTPNP